MFILLEIAIYYFTGTSKLLSFSYFSLRLARSGRVSSILNMNYLTSLSGVFFIEHFTTKMSH
jgi:hypothetical protein